MAVSTLYFTAAGIYRSVGYELVGGFDKVQLPTASLAAVRPADGIRLRRAVPGDGAAIQAVYTAWASRQNGPLTRTGPNFPDGADRITEHYTGVTLALDTRRPGGRLRLLAARQRVRRLRPHRRRRPAGDHAGRDPGAAPDARLVRQRDRLRGAAPVPAGPGGPGAARAAAARGREPALHAPGARPAGRGRTPPLPAGAGHRRSGSPSPGTRSATSTAAGGSASPTAPRAASGPPTSPGRP